MSVQLRELELLDAVRDFALQHPHPRPAAFREAMRDRVDGWRPVAAIFAEIGFFAARNMQNQHGIVEQ